MTENDIIVERIRDYITSLKNTLESKGIEYFNRKPAVEIAHRGKDLMISLVDANLDEITCEFIQTPRKGKKYIFIKKSKVLNDPDPFSFTYLQSKAIMEDLDADNAHNINIERVNRLINDGQYAVALVFIVSAFEAFMGDIFFHYSDLWFDNEISTIHEYNDELYLKYGMVIDDTIDSLQYPKRKTINGQLLGIPRGHMEKCRKWAELNVRNHIFGSCEKLNVLWDYVSQFRSNKFEEIEHFEILKKVLKGKPNNSLYIINFQDLSGNKKGVRNVFKNFYSIDFEVLKEEIQSFQKIIKKRHKVIHGKLRDTEIERELIIKALDTLNVIKNFIRDKLFRQESGHTRNRDFNF